MEKKGVNKSKEWPQESWSRLLMDSIPILILLVMILLQPLPWPFGPFYVIAPRLIWVFIFTCGLFGKQPIHYWLLFLFGFISDLLNMMPFGLGAFGFVACAYLTEQSFQRLAFQRLGSFAFFAYWGLLLPILALLILTESFILYWALEDINIINGVFTIITSWIFFPLFYFGLRPLLNKP